MPYRIRWEGHGVYRRFFGVMTLQEFMDAYREMCGDLRYYDSPDTVQAMVATDPRTLGYVRYYEQIRVSPYCMRDFPTVAEARHWIAGHPRQGWSPPSP